MAATPAAVPKNSRLSAEPESAGAPTALVNAYIGRDEEQQRNAHWISERLAQIDTEVAALLHEQSKLRARASAMESEQQARARGGAFDSALREQIIAQAQTLGFPQPYDYQVDGVSSVLSGTHTAVIWPAGGGKGLLTALTAAMLPGKAIIVIVPLVALASQLCDDVNGMWATEHEVDGGSRRVVAKVLGGSSDKDYNERLLLARPPDDLEARRAATLPRMRGAPPPDPELCEQLMPGSELAKLAHVLQQEPPDGRPNAPLVVFMSPEKLALSLQVHAFLRRLHDLDLLGPCIIDELHCIVEQGYDFRPHYLLIGLFVSALGVI